MNRKNAISSAPALALVVLLLALASACSSGDGIKSLVDKDTTPDRQTQAPSETRSPTKTPVEKTKAPSKTPSPMPSTATSEPEFETVFDNGNISGVSNQPTIPTTFTISESLVIYSIQNYHWNGGQGEMPGTIGLKASDGTEYGPWQTEGTPGQGGVPNAYWTCYPAAKIPAGTYTIIDSDSATWAQNAGSSGAGFSKVVAEK